jgi:hypothetical protein
VLKRRVLCYDPDPVRAVIGERAVVAAGGEPVAVRTLEALQTADLGTCAVAMLVTDLAAVATGDLRAVVDRAARSRCQLVLRTTESAAAFLSFLLERSVVQHVVAEPDGVTDPRELVVLLGQLLGGDPFGIEWYLPRGTDVMRVRITDSRDKLTYVRTASQLAAQLGANARVVERVETIVDELTSNAVFNAPRDAAGAPRYAHLNRRIAVELAPDEAAELALACDGRRMVIAQRDPFGRLTRETVLSYLERCVRRAPGELLASSGGAGIGLYRVWNALTTLVIGVRPGRLTEIVALVDFDGSHRRFRQRPKSLNFFVEEPERTHA